MAPARARRSRRSPDCYRRGKASSAFSVNVDRAWAGALTLIVIVILLNIFARLLARRTQLAS